MEKIVLLMDNDKKFLNSTSRELAQAGYTVREASTIEEAESILCNDRIHLAICDIHMKSDYDGGAVTKYDPLDISGLILAQDVRFQSLPKIILTKYPELDYVRAALGPVPQGRSPAVDFIAKEEGSAVLINAVDNAFAHYVRLNRDLIIQQDEVSPVSLLRIAEAIEPDINGETLISRGAEIEDLFRALFYGETEGSLEKIKIHRMVWKHEARLALSVFVFPRNKPSESRLIVCGRNASVISELSLYKDYSPKFQSSGCVFLQNSSQTIHFAANSYFLDGTSLEHTKSLAKLYEGNSDKSLHIALKALYEKVLPQWHKNQPVLAAENERLDEIYRERLSLTEESMPEDRFAELLRSIARHAHELGARIESLGETLSIRFNGQAYSYPNPTFSLWALFDIGTPALMLNSPGNVSLQNVLTETGENVWMTDFSASGPAPVLWNYLTLEAEFRFDMVEATNLLWLHEMERCLTHDDFSRFEMSDVEAPLRRTMKAIQTIRKLASKSVGSDTSAYHLGILFLALHRLSEFNPVNRLTRSELTRYVHLLMAAAVTIGRIGNRGKAVRIADTEEAGIRIDKQDRLVRIDGARVPIRGQGFDLLCYLHDHLNRLTTRRELVEQVLSERYDPADDSQASRLNTAIHRLREKIEIDEERPRYLLTEPGGGYRLLSTPKS